MVHPECIKPAPVNDNHSPGPSQSFLTPNQKKSLTDVDFLLSLSSSVEVKAYNVSHSLNIISPMPVPNIDFGISDTNTNH